MPLPSLAKTWQFNVNQSIAAAGSIMLTAAAMWQLIKNSLKGFATLPWAVRGSSDSVAAGMDSTDRWVTAANLVWDAPASAHSWIVLRQTGIATNFEICIDLDNAGGGGNIAIVVSPSVGFSGGSVTDRPTAADEYVLLSSAAAAWSGVDADHVVHVMQSTDGQCSRVAVWRASTNLCTFILLDKPANPTTGWTNPHVATAVGIGSAYGNTYGGLSTLSSTISKGFGSAVMALGYTCEGLQASGQIAPQIVGVGDATNDFDNSWPMFPIGVASITLNHKGRHGTLQDLWWRPTGIGQADTFPNDATRLFVVMGDLIFPWNGAVPVIA